MPSDAEEREHDAESGSDESDEDNPVKDAQDAFTRLIAKKPTADQVDNFIDTHRDIVLSNKDHPEWSLLHSIPTEITTRSCRVSSFEPIITRILERQPDMIEKLNDEGQTALYYAMHHMKKSSKLSTLVDYMLSGRDIHIRNVLAKTHGDNDHMKTCLTLAFERNLSGPVLKRMIELTTDEALSRHDGLGKTVLHHAVDYQCCDDNRVEVINLLLQRDEEILKKANRGLPEIFLDHKYPYKKADGSVTELSAYLEHKRTKKEYLSAKKQEEAAEAAKKEEEVKKQHKEREKSSGQPAPPKSGGRDKDKAPAQSSKKQPHSERPGQEPGRQKPDQLSKLSTLQEREREVRADMGRENTNAPSLDTVTTPSVDARGVGDYAANKPLKRIATGDAEAEKGKKTKTSPENKGGKKRTPKHSTPKPGSAELARNSKSVLDLLKLHYMRSRNVKMATSFLYGTNIRKGKYATTL
jgi:hypothetical protein